MPGRSRRCADRSEVKLRHLGAVDRRREHQAFASVESTPFSISAFCSAGVALAPLLELHPVRSATAIAAVTMTPFNIVMRLMIAFPGE